MNDRSVVMNDRSVVMITTSQVQPEPVELWRFVLYFLRLGAIGFGGPIALAGFMQRDLVENRRWVSAEDFSDGLALAQLAPGPLAAQLAIYLGYARAGVLGATAVGVFFIAPSFVLVWALSVAYVRYGGLPWMHAVFYGIGAVVIGVIARSALKLTRLTLARDRMLWGIWVLTAAVTAYTQQEIVWVIVGAGLLKAAVTGWRVRTREAAWTMLPLVGMPAAATAGQPTLTALFLFFGKAGAVVFGSGLAIVPFLYGEVVQTHAWLTERQFLDAVAVAMITPGPVVITVAFIGYLIAGAPGMIVAACGVFLPVYLFVIVPAPYFRRHRSQPFVKDFVSGVTAAATGAIAGATYVLGLRAIVDPVTAALAVGTFLILWRYRISELWLIAAGAALGLAVAAR